MELPPLLESTDPWIQELIAIPADRELWNALAIAANSEATPPITCLTALELIAAANDWSRPWLDDEIKQLALRLQFAIDSTLHPSSVADVLFGRVVKLYPKSYVTDLALRLRNRLKIFEEYGYSIPWLQQNFDLLPQLIDKPVVRARLFAWPGKTDSETDVELELLLQHENKLQPVLFWSYGPVGPIVKYQSIEDVHSSDEEEYQPRLVPFHSPTDWIYHGPEERWRTYLMELEPNGQLGHLAGNRITDIQLLIATFECVEGGPEEEAPGGYRLHFEHGADIWLTDKGDSSLLSIGSPPPVGWTIKPDSPWVSRRNA